MKNAVLVFGYNNTRINDVKKIREKAKKYLDSILILCKSSPTEDDKAAVDGVIDVDLQPSMENVNLVLHKINEMALSITALLPFSDQGTQLGAHLAKKLNLRGPDPKWVAAALDKFIFREQEENAMAPSGYKKIKSKKISTYKELETVFAQANGKVFIKPAKEGNSRGCITLSSEEKLRTAWDEVEKYLNDGVVAEALITEGSEYSWDHVSGDSWVTEKQTTQNNYRAEIQQIVPAPLNLQETELITQAGMFMSELAGSNQGACHNEVFLLTHSKQVAGVEPNLRPAGMRIWDLATLAFNNYDPWRNWLLWAAGKNSPTDKPLHREYYAGIRMIKAPKNGVITKIPTDASQNFFNHQAECMEIKWTKKTGDKVTTLVKDNSEFIGYIIARARNYEDLSIALINICIDLESKISIADE